MPNYETKYDPKIHEPKDLKHIQYTKKGHVAYVTINRPEVMNACHPPANRELAEVFEAKLAAENGIRVRPDSRVVITAGSNLGFMNAVLAIADPGDEFIFPLPYYFNHCMAVTMANCVTVGVKTKPDYQLDVDAIARAITPKTRAVFLTHVLGYNGLSKRLLDELARRKVPLIEDVCESHGATFAGRKLGNFGLMSNFSFYYAHHMSTIEGGMVCTNDPDIYQKVRMLRSHGMVRESTDPATRAAYQAENPELNPDFIFAFPAFNVRNTEIGAILGRQQLKRLDENVALRTRNLELFLSLIDPSRYRTDFKLEGSSNYAFNLVLKHPDSEAMGRLMDRLHQEGVEFRRGSAGGGNQLRQPYLRGIVPADSYKAYPETDHVHFYGMYIGNFPDLSEAEVRSLCEIVNGI